MANIFSRIISGILGVSLFSSFIPNFEVKADVAESYPYTFFAGSNEENAISIESNSICINGLVASNGTIQSSIELNNNSIYENAGEDLLYVPSKINNLFFSDYVIYEDGYYYEDTNINIYDALESSNDVILNGNINLDSAIRSYNDITISGDSLNCHDGIIYSENGNIDILSDNVSMTGLIYAPMGTVNINSTSINLNNIIVIAQSIEMKSDVLNANYNRRMAELLGIESEEEEIFEDDGTNSDYDLLTDFEEINIGTNRYDADTDGDGYDDYFEVNNGMDPLTFNIIEISEDRINKIHDNKFTDLESLNANEYYPLEVEYNDYGYISSIIGKWSDVSVNNASDALYAVYSIKSLAGFDSPKDEFKYIQAEYSDNGNMYFFNQYYNSIEISEAFICIDTDKDGNVISFSSTYIPADNLSDLNTEPEILEENINLILKNEYSEDVTVSNIDLLIYNNTDTQLVYFVNTDNDNIFIIDAHSGEIIEMYDTKMYESMVDASALIYEETTKREFKALESKGKYYLKDEERNYSVNLFEGPLEDNDKIYSSDNKDDWTENDAAVATYTNISKVYDWWKNKKKYRGTNGKGSKFKITLNNDKTDNAASISGNITFFASSLNKEYTWGYLEDTVAHEYSHCVFSKKGVSGWGISNELKIINEAYADIFSSLICGKWRTFPRYLPDPENTTTKIEIPNHYTTKIIDYPDNVDSEFFDESDEHINSTIISHIAYLLDADYDISMENQISLWYDSMTYKYKKSSYFNEVRTNVIKSARKNNFTDDQISDIITAFSRAGIKGKTGSAKINIYDGDSSWSPTIPAKITASNYGATWYQETDENGRAFFNDLPSGTVIFKVEVNGMEPIIFKLYIEEGKTITKNINILTTYSNYDWVIYDHENYSDPFFELPEHIDITGNDIVMTGYGADPLKDFMLTDEAKNLTSFVHSEAKVLSFKIERDKADWHTMEGGGFLFDVNISIDNKLNAHCVLVEQNGLVIYQIEDIDIDDFRNGKIGNIRKVGTKITEVSIPNVKDEHFISVNILKYLNDTKETVSVWDGDNLIINSCVLDYFPGDDFGPITSHIDHYCSQKSFFTFSDIQMTSVN